MWPAVQDAFNTWWTIHQVRLELQARAIPVPAYVTTMETRAWQQLITIGQQWAQSLTV